MVEASEAGTTVGKQNLYKSKESKASQSKKPLSNSEVRQLLVAFEKGESGTVPYMTGNEQGTELRK